MKEWIIFFKISIEWKKWNKETTIILWTKNCTKLIKHVKAGLFKFTIGAS